MKSEHAASCFPKVGPAVGEENDAYRTIEFEGWSLVAWENEDSARIADRELAKQMGLNSVDLLHNALREEIAGGGVSESSLQPPSRPKHDVACRAQRYWLSHSDAVFIAVSLSLDDLVDHDRVRAAMHAFNCSHDALVLRRMLDSTLGLVVKELVQTHVAPFVAEVVVQAAAATIQLRNGTVLGPRETAPSAERGQVEFSHGDGVVN